MVQHYGSLKCNCDDVRAFWCPIHEYKKKTLGNPRTNFKHAPVHDTVAVDELNNGIVGDRLIALKANMTPAENKMFNILVELGIDFLYQCVIYPYYADFILWQYSMVLELDGSSHDKRDEHDDIRSAKIESLGIEVRRIENRYVSKETVMEHLKDLPIWKKEDIKKKIDDHNKKFYQ